jgi:short-subunit dehydrogenase involved in D-alanine esterification of teichoic acids
MTDFDAEQWLRNTSIHDITEADLNQCADELAAAKAMVKDYKQEIARMTHTIPGMGANVQLSARVKELEDISRKLYEALKVLVNEGGIGPREMFLDGQDALSDYEKARDV